MKNRLRVLTLAAGVLLCGFAAMEAKAGPVLVNQDGGSFNWSLTSNGAGLVTVTFTDVKLTQIDNTGISAVSGTFATGNVLSIASVTLPSMAPFDLFNFTAASTKSFGDTGANVAMSYTLAAPPGTSNAFTNDGFLNVTGAVDKGNPVTNLLPGYDFSPFKAGGTLLMQMNVSGSPIPDIGAVIINGGTITGGTGAFTQNASAVPEPASLALLGIGMTGFLAFRRFFKKTSVA